MPTIDFDTQISIRQAYLTMFEYLDRYWNERDKPEVVGDILSQLSLWDSEEGKTPMDASVFPEWLDCAQKVINQENTADGYRNADIKLS